MELLVELDYEQCGVFNEAISLSDEFSDQPSVDIRGAIKRNERITLTVNNFFQLYTSNYFRGTDYFCEYISSLNDEGLLALNDLFLLMKEEIYLEVTVSTELNLLEIFYSIKGTDDVELIVIDYSKPFQDFLELYTTKQINLNVTLKELMQAVGNYTGYSA